MIHPRRDTLIALFATLAAWGALAWGLERLVRLGGEDLAGGVAVVTGALVGVFAVLVLVNFLAALRLARRMERGEGVIARWTPGPAAVTAFRAAEAALPRAARSRWRPKAGAAEILFSADGVLAGGQYHALPSDGVNRVRAVEVVPGVPAAIQFQLSELSATTTRVFLTGVILRYPLAHGAEAAAQDLQDHFRRVIARQTTGNPGFWPRRRRAGLIGAGIGCALAAIGYVLAGQTGWQADDLPGGASILLLALGLIIAVLAGLVATVAALALRR
jgi:hypothetical protein